MGILSEKYKRLAVFCGSNIGREPVYKQAAASLAIQMADAGVGLVYGGASVGLMGVIANSMLAKSAEVVGVITQSLVDVEIAHRNLTQLEVVDTMHQRKARMAEIADGFIMIPGGSGSLDEFFEIFTWLQLGYHNKPCAILNVAGYFDSLLAFINNAVDKNFIKPEHASAIIVANSTQDLLAQLANYSSKLTAKWVEA